MTTTLTTYTATSWRDGTSWVVRVPQLDRTTRAPRLSQVEAAARRLVGAVTGEDAGLVRVVVDVQVPEGISRVLEAAAAARQEADLVSVAAVALRRTLARRLGAHGYGLREIAVVLGVSPTRARQLAADPGRSSFRRRPHSSYQHEAFLYRDPEEFLAGTVPFVQDGLRLGQPALVALPEPRLRQLRAALGPDGAEVEFCDLTELGANPARIVPFWLAFLARHEGRPVRGIGESQWPGRRPEAAMECRLHEGLLNLAVDPDVALWLRCPYDVARLPAPLIESALASHPAVVEGADYRGSTLYGGLHHVNSLFRAELPPPPAECARLTFGLSELSSVRRQVGRRAAEVGLDAGRTADLTQAVAELAANSARHGGGRGELLTWLQPGALVCEVTDRGRLGSPMAGQREVGAEQEQGRGLWLAHQLSDLVQLRSTARGTAARVFTWL